MIEMVPYPELNPGDVVEIVRDGESRRYLAVQVKPVNLLRVVVVLPDPEDDP